MAIFKKHEMAKHPKESGEVLSASTTNEVQQMPDNGTEKCVCCGCDTGVPFDMPISERRYYEVGSGQLCGDCYRKLHIYPEESYSPERYEEMDLLLRLCRNDKENCK